MIKDTSKAAARPNDVQTRIVAVYNQKGGCGKTSISMQLAGTLAMRGFRTMVIDMDAQGTASHWSANSGVDETFPATVVSLARHESRMMDEVEKMFGLYDFIIIDCPPAIDSAAPWAALQAADLGLIPVMPVMDNIWASTEARALGVRAQKENASLQLRYVISRMKRGKVYESCLRQIHNDEFIPTLSSMIYDRNAYPESQLIGQTVHARDNRAAIDEVNALTDQVMSVLDVKKKKVKK